MKKTQGKLLIEEILCERKKRGEGRLRRNMRGSEKIPTTEKTLQFLLMCLVQT